MRRERKVVDDRQRDILKWMRKTRRATVEELAELFSASTMTIRRDLQILEEQGLVRRFHGGAESLQEPEEGSSLEEILYTRRVLAKYAASLIEDGDTIFINGSSTALMIAEYIEGKRVRIITNNVNCKNCSVGPDVTFWLTGGDLSYNGRVLVGDFAINNLLQCHADKTFLGFAGISSSGDVICDVSLEIGAHQIMMNHCDRFYIILDHEKIGNLVDGPICSLETGGMLITDQYADPKILERLKETGIGVKIVEVPERS